MKQLALVILSVCVAFAQTQQVSVGNNSPNIDHVAGNLTITYTVVEQGPCAIVSGTFPDSVGHISSDYPSSLFKDADATGLSLGPSDRPFISEAGTSLPNTFGFPPDFTADGLPTSLASPVKPLSWLEDSKTTSDRPLTGGVIADYPSLLLSVSTIIDYKLSLPDVIADSTVADSISGTHIDNPIFANTLTVRTALDSSLFANTSLGSSSIIAGTDSLSTDSLLPYKNVIEIADGHIDNPIFANTLTVRTALDSSLFANTSLGSSSIIAGTDYASLSKSLADLTARGDAITGWSITYLPGDHR